MPLLVSFCIESWYQDKFGKKDSLRRRSVDVVIAELVQAKAKYGIEAVLFFDDVFTVQPKWIREFAPRYKAEVGLPARPGDHLLVRVLLAPERQADLGLVARRELAEPLRLDGEDVVEEEAPPRCRIRLGLDELRDDDVDGAPAQRILLPELVLVQLSMQNSTE